MPGFDLSARKSAGEEIDARKIRKHANDVIRLAQLLAPDVGLLLFPVLPTTSTDSWSV
jgi:hypothetical protein